MNKEDLKNMANNPDFIPGIYDYCDRWCQRCLLSSRCFLFATEEREFPEDESRDINSEEFWKRIRTLDQQEFFDARKIQSQSFDS